MSTQERKTSQGKKKLGITSGRVSPGSRQPVELRAIPVAQFSAKAQPGKQTEEGEASSGNAGSPNKFQTGSKLYQQPSPYEAADTLKSPPSTAYKASTTTLQRRNRPSVGRSGDDATAEPRQQQPQVASGDLTHVQQAHDSAPEGDAGEGGAGAAGGDGPKPRLVADYRSISPSIFSINLAQNQQSQQQVAEVAPPSGSQSPNQIIVTIQSKKNGGERTPRRGSSSPGQRGRRRHPRDKFPFPLLDAKKQPLASWKVVQPLPYVDPRKLGEATKAAIAAHSRHVTNITDRYATYTSPKTIPTAMQSKWKTVLHSFKRNFHREAQFVEAAKQRAKQSYLTEDETRGRSDAVSYSPTKSKGYQTQDSTILKKPAQSTLDFNLRDAIEKHATSVTALRNQAAGRSSLRFADVEVARRKRARYLERKGREIAGKLELSPQTCCTKLYRVLTPEQPLRLHNQPLSHMVRPMQKMVAEKQANRKRQRQAAERANSADLRRRVAHLSIKSLGKQFQSQLGGQGGLRHQTRQERLDMHERIDRLVKEFNARKFNRAASEPEKEGTGRSVRAKRGKDDFALQRREWEHALEQGRSFSHLSAQFPIKKKWKPYLASLRQKEADRIAKEKKQDEIVQGLADQGVTDERIIQRELDLLDFREIQERQQREKKRMGIKDDPQEMSLQIAPLTLGMDGDDDGPGGFTLEDFAGIETAFEKESLQQRQVRVLKARERLRAKKEKALELKKKAEEAKEFAEDQPGGDLKGVMGAERSAAWRTPAGDGMGGPAGDAKAQAAVEGKGGFFQLVSQSKETDDATKGVQARKLRLGVEPRQRLAAAISQPHPNTIKETITNESSIQTQRLGKDMQITVAVSPKGDPRKATGEASQRAGAAGAEYGLAEDGGIFSAALVQNTSHEEPQEASRVSFPPSDEESEDSARRFDKSAGLEDASQSAKGDLIHIKTNALYEGDTLEVEDLRKASLVMLQDQREQQRSETSQHLNETQELQKSQQSISRMMQGTSNEISRHQLEAAQRIRPSTTENVVRNARKRIRQRRQIMSSNLKDLDPSKRNTIGLNDSTGPMRLSNSRERSFGVNQSLEHSAGNMTQPVRMMRGRRFERSGPQLLPQGRFRSGHAAHMLPDSHGTTQSNFMSIGRRTLGADRSRGRGTPDQQFDTGKLTRAQTATNNDIRTDGQEEESLSEFKIWKEVMKFKATGGYEGDDKVPRHQVTRIRTEIRVKKRKQMLKRKRSRASRTRSGGSPDESPLNLAMGNGSPKRLGTGLESQLTQTPQKSMNQEQYESQKVSILNDLNTTQQSMKNAPIDPAHTTLPLIGSTKSTQPRHGLSDTDANVHLQTEASNQYNQVPQNHKQIVAGQLLIHEPSREWTSGQQSGPASTAKMQAALNQSMKQIGPLNQSLQQWNYMTRQPGLNEPFIIRQEDQQYTYSQSGSADRKTEPDFVEYNRQMARSAQGRNRHSSHLGRLRMLKQQWQARGRDTIYQARLLQNASNAEMMHNQRNLLGMKQLRPQAMSLKRMQRMRTAASTRVHYSTASQLHRTYRDQLNDKRSLQVFDKNELHVDPGIDNKFSRQETWNQTLNCPYYGLHALRQKQEVLINMPFKDENLLQPFTMGNSKERRAAYSVKKAVKHKNRSQLMDRKVFNIIEQCESLHNVEWQQIYDENEDFRNKQAILHSKEQKNKNLQD